MGHSWGHIENGRDGSVGQPPSQPTNQASKRRGGDQDEGMEGGAPKRPREMPQKTLSLPAVGGDGSREGNFDTMVRIESDLVWCGIMAAKAGVQLRAGHVTGTVVTVLPGTSKPLIPPTRPDQLRAETLSMLSSERCNWQDISSKFNPLSAETRRQQWDSATGRWCVATCMPDIDPNKQPLLAEFFHGPNKAVALASSLSSIPLGDALTKPHIHPALLQPVCHLKPPPSGWPALSTLPTDSSGYGLHPGVGPAVHPVRPNSFELHLATGPLRFALPLPPGAVLPATAKLLAHAKLLPQQAQPQPGSLAAHHQQLLLRLRPLLPGRDHGSQPPGVVWVGAPPAAVVEAMGGLLQSARKALATQPFLQSAAAMGKIPEVPADVPIKLCESWEVNETGQCGLRLGLQHALHLPADTPGWLGGGGGDAVGVALVQLWGVTAQWRDGAVSLSPRLEICALHLE